ncbi:2-oxoglutarate and iron-dependent oxygenase domain-containing protein 2-like [Anneissia japonica]|uniref:2-oxoglutarate and iron-dependent oxygenase domain-containing protein 2-like n=1 Tax=Anneissia japonica TaxID=1529436 RepID=UPI00142550F2|nr:2-oxoglutarate and iron-dependent oxygenase domain-containing protein 2-like [Anneissia japonica]
MSDDQEIFYVCSCYYTHNIFLSQFSLHVTYIDDETFSKNWRQILKNKGCTSDEAYTDVLKQVKTEVERRKSLGHKYLERRQKISEGYTPLHPNIYKLQTSYLSPKFLELVEVSKQDSTSKENLLKRINIEKGERIYSFPMFTEEFCHLFKEEIEHFEGTDLPKGRPNTMNNYGVLMNELGFDKDFITPLRLSYITPITRLLYPDWGGDSLDSHKAFVVKYKIGEDLSLNYHYDNAEVTVNLSLESDFSEGSLYFGGMRHLRLEETECTEYCHKPTHGLIHRGQHMHGALPISHGERYNLIIWMRSSRVRNKLCPMCDRKPQLIKTVGFGDGFTKTEKQTVDVCCAL